MKTRYKILIAIFIIVLIIALFYNNYQLWNDGYCIKCGTKYEAISRGNGSETYYECPNCRFGLWY